jgi:nucleoside-diphosphate-sugar epimerase
MISGNQGYIGKVMTKLMLKKGFEIVGLDTDYYYDCDIEYTEKENTHKIKQITKDVRDVNEKDFEGIDVVCHLAALSNDPLGELEPILTRNINHTASVNIAKLAKKMGVKRFLFSSSCSMYGISGEKHLTEESKLNPLTAYAKSKVDTERDISALADEEFSPVFLRNATAYGFSPRFRFDLVLNNLAGYAFTTGKITIKSDGTPWRPLVHIEDISRAFVAAIEAPVEVIHNQAFNVGQNKENYQIKNIANAVKNVIPGCEIEYTNEHGSDSRTYNVNFDKIHSKLPSFEPQWNITKGVIELYEAFKKCNLSYDEFMSRKYTRLKHLNYLIKSKKLNEGLYWR